MKVKEVDQCSFPNWYYIFKNITVPSTLIELDSTFLEYLLTDKIILPKGWDYKNDDLETEFVHLLTKIDMALKRFDGKVFPKLNWSAPKDACYMICGRELKCTHPSDVIYLLKASEFVTHDLTAAYKLCSDVNEALTESKTFLILKQWRDINVVFEFRCFVKDKTLMAISQRYGDVYSNDIHTNIQDYVGRIREFFVEQILPKFPLASYIFDLYVSSSEILLIDFNVFCADLTSSALFQWKDLLVDIDPDSLPLVAFVENEQQVVPHSFEQYARPIDVEMGLGDGNCSLLQFLQKEIAEQNSDSDDEQS